MKRTAQVGTISRVSKQSGPTRRQLPTDPATSAASVGVSPVAAATSMNTSFSEGRRCVMLIHGGPATVGGERVGDVDRLLLLAGVRVPHVMLDGPE